VHSVNVTHPLSVDRPADEAIRLFTPEGERLWVEGWDPTYPAGEPGEGVGTVFVTGAGDRTTVWTIVDSAADRKRYARVAPDTAGTVEVAVERSTGRETVLHVTYALTALNDAGRAELDGFAAGYADYIGSWEAAVREALAAGS
jgi:hypothetical protein